jgi:hypothetical protein
MFLLRTADTSLLINVSNSVTDVIGTDCWQFSVTDLFGTECWPLTVNNRK